MIEKLIQLVDHYNNIVEKMSNADVIADRDKYTALAKEHRQLTPTIELAKKYILRFIIKFKKMKKFYKEMMLELKEIVKEELSDFKKELSILEDALKIKLLPRDPNDDKNIILEIRSGTGGNEAALFANDLFRMYTRYSEESKMEK